jgi:hypothetical protein
LTLPFVTTGLDPVVHAEMQFLKPFGESAQATLPHGLPGLMFSPAMTSFFVLAESASACGTTNATKD